MNTRAKLVECLEENQALEHAVSAEEMAFNMAKYDETTEQKLAEKALVEVGMFRSEVKAEQAQVSNWKAKSDQSALLATKLRNEMRQQTEVQKKMTDDWYAELQVAESKCQTYESEFSSFKESMAELETLRKDKVEVGVRMINLERLRNKTINELKDSLTKAHNQEADMATTISELQAEKAEFSEDRDMADR